MYVSIPILSIREKLFRSANVISFDISVIKDVPNKATLSNNPTLYNEPTLLNKPPLYKVHHR